MWNIIQCAVQGRAHKKSNIPCQDKTNSSFLSDVTVVALADGAGSAKMSEYGAELATKNICSLMVENFDNYFRNDDGATVKSQIIDELVDVLQKKSEELDCEIKELASTLLFVAVKNEHFILSHIGDGVIGYLKEDELKIASQPENGEFSNETTFVTSQNSIMNMRLIKGELGKIEGFVLMSDGAEISLYNKKENKLSDGLKKIIKMSNFIDAKILEEQLKRTFENVITKATTDDCSIVIMARKNETFKGYKNLSISDKCRVLEIGDNTSRKIVNRYDIMLEYLVEKKTLNQIAQKLRIKAKYARKYVEKLRKMNYVEKEGRLYHTILIMDN